MSERWRWLDERLTPSLGGAIMTIGLLGLTAAWYQGRIGDDRIGAFVVRWLTFGLVSLISVLLHEIGHALAAHMAGLVPCVFRAGVGPA